jgi:hypothetical protein
MRAKSLEAEQKLSSITGAEIQLNPNQKQLVVK